MNETPVMVKDCTVGLSRLSAVDEDGVMSADALSIECETDTHGELTIFFNPALAPYLARACREVYREFARREGSGFFRALALLRFLVVVGLAVAYLIVGFFFGFHESTQIIAMGLGGWYVLGMVVRIISRYFVRHVTGKTPSL